MTGDQKTESEKASLIHPWIRRYLKDDQIQKLSDLVSEIEKRTEGEIVPMIVQRSSTVGHVPYVLTLFFTLIFLTTEFYLFQWSSRSEFNLHLSGAVVLLFGLSLFLSRFKPVQRWFTPNADEVRQVWHRAELEFYRNGLHRTEKRVGVLVFVSVMERRAVILADEGLSSKVQSEVWAELVGDLSHHLRQGQWAEGFEKVLRQAGSLLEEMAPVKGLKSANELKNSLRILD